MQRHVESKQPAAAIFCLKASEELALLLIHPLVSYGGPEADATEDRGTSINSPPLILRTTLRKYFGETTPFTPGVRITLLTDLNNGTESVS